MFISTVEGVEFYGSWMLVCMWDKVHPYPHGSATDITVIFFPDVYEVCKCLLTIFSQIKRIVDLFGGVFNGFYTIL